MQQLWDSRVCKGRLWGAWQGFVLVGGPVGKGQNLSKRVFRITAWERKSLRSGEEERVRRKREEVRMSKWFQPSNKLLKMTTKRPKKRFQTLNTGINVVNSYHSKVSTKWGNSLNPTKKEEWQRLSRTVLQVCGLCLHSLVSNDYQIQCKLQLATD